MKMIAHVHTSVSENIFEGLLHSVLLESILETLIIIPFLFLTYLLMEFIEHRAGEKTFSFLKKSGAAGPAVGSLLGAAPQCAFSAVAANLYTGRVITLGTLISIFLSTSDEMLMIMIGEGVRWQSILLFVGYKVAVGILVGFIIDFALKLTHRTHNHVHIDGMCEDEGCHCERGILRSAIHHTLTVTAFIFAVTLAINTLIFFIGTDILGDLMSRIPVLSHFLSALIGLIPGCATSVALTSLCTHGIISGGVMLSGLFSGAGVGLLVLLKVNKDWRENLTVMGILVAAGFIFGLIFDLTGLSTLI